MSRDAHVAAVRRMAVGGEKPYDVVVGRLDDAALSAALGGALTGALGHGVRRVAVVHAGTTGHVERVRRVLAGPGGLGLEVLDLPVPDGEDGKRAAVAEQCWERLGAAGFTRSDAVVTVGGGAVTDLGGFVAATWLRGIPVLHLPTSLLGMVDAAVGGKTGINTGAGKNLVGAFHEPAGVVCDLAALDSLPRAELVAGLGEVVKCGFVADPEILRLVEEHDPDSLTTGSPVLRELVERAIAVKIDVVVGDLRETGGGTRADQRHPGREVLNYGHTMGHAVERASGYAVRHGEAVAIGCCYVAELAAAEGLLARDVADRHARVFQRVGLPTGWSGASYEELRAAMGVDKKARGDRLRFVVLTGLARPRVLEGPDEASLRAAYRVMTGADR